MVLITGGASGVPSSDVNLAAELYDPIRGTFTATGSMSVERTWDTATLLGNGKVLIVDGQDPEVTTTKHLSMTTVPGLAQARTGWQVPRVWQHKPFTQKPEHWLSLVHEFCWQNPLAPQE
jgi:hypothetical protein